MLRVIVVILFLSQILSVIYGISPLPYKQYTADEGGCHSTYSISQAGLKYGQFGRGRVFVGECDDDQEYNKDGKIMNI